MNKFNWLMKASGVFLLLGAAAVSLPAQTTTAPLTVTFTTLLNFDFTDGAGSYALVQATDGKLYGTTGSGGAGICKSNQQNYGCGTFFNITTDGNLTTLLNFDGKGQGGANLVQATDGNFYGTTYEDGTNVCLVGKRNHGCGTFFKLTPNGVLTTLYNFCSQGGSSCTDGRGPLGGLIQAADRNFYGVTYEGGGSLRCEKYGCGTVFKITASGTLTTLHSFNGSDGVLPAAALVQGTDGNFYGTTYVNGVNDNGTVFKITPSGALTTLYKFCSQTGCTDGSGPETTLVQGADGNFYGTTSYGGANDDGTVFKITSSGALTTLVSFTGTDGELPGAGLVQGTDGNFYGTTYLGGAYDGGEVFQIAPSGVLTTLHSFDGTDGDGPEVVMVQDTNGTFYGTTSDGGTNADCEYGCGTVFSLSVGLGPFVETQPTSGVVGAAVTILGTNLIGATSVTFNGISSTFTVVSASEITTTVPAGATTGTVKVVTPKGTLSSNVPFTVTP